MIFIFSREGKDFFIAPQTFFEPFKAYIQEDYLYVDAWSNSSVMAGICITMMKIFNVTPVKDMEAVDIDFHVKSGLIDHLTPLRRMGLEGMIQRITVLFPHRTTNEI